MLRPAFKASTCSGKAFSYHLVTWRESDVERRCWLGALYRDMWLQVCCLPVAQTDGRSLCIFTRVKPKKLQINLHIYKTINSWLLRPSLKLWPYSVTNQKWIFSFNFLSQYLCKLRFRSKFLNRFSGNPIKLGFLNWPHTATSAEFSEHKPKWKAWKYVFLLPAKSRTYTSSRHLVTSR